MLIDKVNVGVMEIKNEFNEEKGICESVAYFSNFIVTHGINNQEVTFIIDGKEYNVDALDLVQAVHLFAPTTFAFQAEL